MKEVVGLWKDHWKRWLDENPDARSGMPLVPGEEWKDIWGEGGEFKEHEIPDEGMGHETIVTFTQPWIVLRADVRWIYRRGVWYNLADHEAFWDPGWCTADVNEEYYEILEDIWTSLVT